MLRKPKTQTWNDRQMQFLSAYRERPEISRAARLAGVHRATIYRWMIDTAFVEAMKAACDAFFVCHRAKVIAIEAERRHWREANERARLPMRCHYLALARAAKCRAH